METLLQTILVSAGSVAALFILTKLMGYRQMSQLSLFDYVNGITIGSIAAEMATSLENDFIKPLTAMIIYTIAAVILSRMSEASIIARRFIVGRPKLLFNNGKLYYRNLKKSHLDITEFLTQCRIQGYFDLSQLQSIIMEANGRLSFLPRASYRPATPNDLKLTPQEETIAATVIIDGHIIPGNLQTTGNNQKWLTNKLKACGITNISHVALATCDANNHLNVYIQINDIPRDNLV